jgi:DNA-binding IclR family transcriptional regulator
MAAKRARSKRPVSRTTAKTPKNSRQASAGVGARGDDVVSLRRSLEILRAFEPDDGPLSRHDIAQRTGLPNTTVARLVHTLLTLGYLSRVGTHSSYRPGPSVLAIGHALIEALPIGRIARPLMPRFATEFGVWVTLGTAEGDKILVLEHSASLMAPDIRVRSGSLLPMVSTALGRAYLWAQTPERRADYLAKLELSGRSSEPRLREDIKLAFVELDRSRFCTAFGSWRRDTLAIGTPIVMHQDGQVLALACGNLSRAANARALAEKGGPALLRLAADIKNGLLQSGSLEDL